MVNLSYLVLTMSTKVKKPTNKVAIRTAYQSINTNSDQIMNIVLGAYFICGILLSFFYNTQWVAIGVGGLCVLAYMLAKVLLPQKRLHQYVLSAVFAVFSAQFVYQMHGMFEMHFFFFVGSALLITYRNWTLMLPITLLTVIHHATFALIQYNGLNEIYFTQLDYMNLQAFLFHVGLAAVIFGICGYWSFDLGRATKVNAEKTFLLEKQMENVQHNIAFAEEISAGDFETDYSLDEEDELGKSLLKMRDNLKVSAQREQQEKFITVGITKIGDIIRQHGHNLELLSNEFIKGMVKYIGLNQGGLFLEEGDNTNKYLNLTACYAYDRKKYLNKKIEIGEGLIGQCYLEREPIYMTEVPKDYARITSGLGDATPSCIYLVPVKTQDDIVGVIELASFRKLEEFEKEFIERAAENIASAIVSSRTTQRIKSLLEDSQQRAEEMRSQEEEMRQNMEELTATQEEMKRQVIEAAQLKQTLEIRDNEVFGITTVLSEADLHGTITHVNRKLCEISKYTKEELIGKPHNVFRHPDMPKELFKLFWQTIKSGKVFRGIVKNKAKDGSYYWVDATIVPIKDENGTIVKYVGARYHITDDNMAVNLYNQQAEKNGWPLLKEDSNPLLTVLS